MSNLMIDLVNICKSFGDHHILTNLNLSIEKGETMVIIGRSGGGKSVILKHMIGLLRPNSGQVFVDDSDITKISGRDLDKIRMKFGMLFQGAALFDSLTVWENVGFTLIDHSNLSVDQINERVLQSLTLVEF